ncbi:MAG: retroviral-like aspartic protease family protein [Dechloromonas sp.]|nr:MAG: retroviral-like aspartic protease family protein [Dechloromonas sp.]
MGIYDRDWYRKQAKQQFQSSSCLNARQESKARSKFERYTNSFLRTNSNYTGRKSFLTNTLIWLGLGALCFSLFTWTSAPKVSVTGNHLEIIIPRAQDGHHYIDGVLNGKQIRFLIDTGASYVSIDGNLAAQLGLLSGKPTKFETANGSVIGQLFENQSIKVSGLATPPLTIGVMPNSPNTALLGQNFLRHVELLQVDNKLILRGRNAGLASQSPMIARAKISMYAGLTLLLLAWLSSFLLMGSRRRS